MVTTDSPEERSQPTGKRPVSSAERQRVVEALCEHYAQDDLDLDEFERRLDRANRVTGSGELAELLSDLPKLEGSTELKPVRRASGSGSAGTAGGDSGPGTSLTVPAGAGRVDSRRIPDSQFEVAVFSGRERAGSWVPARTIRVGAFMGGAVLDFREALFGPGEIRIHCVAVMGGVEIIVPPGVHVDVGGFAVMGGFEEQLSGGGPIAADAPTLRITGMAFMGAVEVHSRLPGESSREARRRIRRGERKQLDRARDREDEG